MKRLLRRTVLIAGTLVLMQAGSVMLVRPGRVSEQASAIPSPSSSPTMMPVTPSASPRPAPEARKTHAAASIGGPAQPSATCGRTGTRVVRFRIEVDRGLPTTPSRFTKDVLSILCDRRSWIAGGRVRFRYDPKASLLIGLRTKENKDRICYPFTGYGSCQKPGQVVINADRWFGGSAFLPLTVSDYRRLVINHEVGHALGQRHRGCSAEGAPAPAMMQQSLGLTTDGRTCRANPWPLSYELRTVR